MKKNSVLISHNSALCWRGAMRKIFLWLLVIAVLGGTAIVEAQQPKKVYRVGYLSIGSALKDQDEAFLKGLRELGYVEGQNIFIEWRFFKDKVDRLSGLAAELAGFKVDCIVTVGVLTTRAAKQATSTIPIVMANASDDPVRQGLVASLARPGGNVTGFIDVSSDLTGKRLELLKETVPKTSRIAILWDPAAPAAAGEFREAEVAARALGVQLQSLEVRGTGDFENAFRATGKGLATDLYLSGTTFFTLGLGDVAPQGSFARLHTVIESGLGFGFLAIVIGYFPVIYQAFSRREVTISLLDARAGSPPSAAELLRRHGGGDEGAAALQQLLHEWERWSAELLETHLSYPLLAYFRSQHSNQSWLAALTAGVGAGALVMVAAEGACAPPARLTFAMARHAVRS